MSLQTLIDDMTLANDGPLDGANLAKGWANAAVVSMGRDNRGVATPTYWNPANTFYIGTGRWGILVLWWVLYRGEGDDTTANVRVQLRNLKGQLFRTSTGAWASVMETNDLSGGNYDADVINSFGSAILRQAVEGGGREFRMPTGAANNIHGWGNPFSFSFESYASDLGNLFVTVEGRLVKDDVNGPDESAAANITLDVGGDFYANGSTAISQFSPEQYNPGSGGSRYKKLTADWQTFHFMPLAVPGAATRIETPRSSTIALRTVTQAWLEGNLPPGLTTTPTPTPTPTPAPAPAVAGPPSDTWFPLTGDAWERLISQASVNPTVDRIESNGPIAGYLNDEEIVLTFTAYLSDGSLASGVDVDTIASGSRAKIEGNSVTLATEPNAQTDANGQLAVRLTPTGTPGGSTVTVSIGSMQASASVQVAGRDRPVTRYSSVWGQPLARPY